MNTDSLRAALDATVLSPAGQAVGVGDDGQVIGVTSYDRLRAAIHAARKQPIMASTAGRTGRSARTARTGRGTERPDFR